MKISAAPRSKPACLEYCVLLSRVDAPAKHITYAFTLWRNCQKQGDFFYVVVMMEISNRDSCECLDQSDIVK